MELNFKRWLNEGYATGKLLGVLAPINDALGQYPFLYATSRISDIVTYIDIMYKGKPPSKNGIIDPSRDVGLDKHKKTHSVWNHPSSLGKVTTSI